MLANSKVMLHTPYYECCKRCTTALQTQSMSRSQMYMPVMALLGYRTSPSATELRVDSIGDELESLH